MDERSELMTMRIQPQLIEIPKEDPFKNDLLGRKEPVEILTGLLHSVEGPCVLAVDAPWGAGKTTFLRMLTGHLRNQAFPVVNFNAWETDFTGDPFLGLSEELTNGLRGHTTGTLSVKIDKVRKAAKEVLRLAVPGAIRLVSAGLLDIRPLMEKEVSQALASLAQTKLTEYLDARDSLQGFKASLEALAADLAKSNDGKPLIVVIDELDRCRPSYAVELLETAKHLFSVDGIVFVLAVNGSELSHSVRAVYGSGFDAVGYLRRFFDVDFRLPDVDRRRFIDSALRSAGIDALQHKEAADTIDIVKSLVPNFFMAADLSLRQISQAIHRLALVLASVRKDKRTFATAATVALIMRTIDPALYHKFVRGEAEDRDAIEALRSRRRGFKNAHIEHYLEATIIVAAMEIRNPDRDLEFAERSPLMKQYLESTEQQGEGNEPDARGREVVRIFEHLCQNEYLGNRLGFREAARRIELLSPSLIDDDDSESDARHRDGQR